MIPGFSRNWRRTSSTTPPAARPTASIESEAKSVTIMPPISRPMRTGGSSIANTRFWPAAASSDLKPAKSTIAASTAEPMAYPLVTALVVLPTASSGSVTLRTSSGRSAISAMPPALSVIGPNASSATMRPVSESWPMTATPMP